MLVTNKFFVNEIFIPHASPSVTDSIVGVSASMADFIEEYERKCLITCLGTELYLDLVEVIDMSQPNHIKESVEDENWDKLVNGEVYTDTDGKRKIWRGLIYKDSPTGFPKSFIANYIYFFYEMMEDDDRVGVGNVKQQAENSRVVPKTPKVVKAWNKFVEETSGLDKGSVLVRNVSGLGLDWYANRANGFSTLDYYIKTKISQGVETFKNYSPDYQREMNYFGI